MKKRGMNRLVHAFDALSTRERVFVMVAVMAVITMLWHSILIEPLNQKQKQIGLQQKTLEAETKVLAIEEKQVMKRGALNSGSAEAKEIEALQQQLQDMDTQIKRYAANVVTPSEMTELLRTLFEQQNEVELVGLNSLKPETMIIGVASAGDQSKQKKDKKTAAANQAVIYKHGMQIEVSGTYLGILSFMEALEKLKWEIYWDAFSLQSKVYPLNRAEITLHTISLDDAWIGL